MRFANSDLSKAYGLPRARSTAERPQVIEWPAATRPSLAHVQSYRLTGYRKSPVQFALEGQFHPHNFPGHFHPQESAASAPKLDRQAYAGPHGRKISCKHEGSPFTDVSTSPFALTHRTVPSQHRTVPDRPAKPHWYLYRVAHTVSLLSEDSSSPPRGRPPAYWNSHPIHAPLRTILTAAQILGDT